MAGPDEIDGIMKLERFPMGPLRLADLIGLDVCRDIMLVLHEGLGHPDKYAPCPKLVELVEAGHLAARLDGASTTTRADRVRLAAGTSVPWLITTSRSSMSTDPSPLMAGLALPLQPEYLDSGRSSMSTEPSQLVFRNRGIGPDIDGGTDSVHQQSISQCDQIIETIPVYVTSTNQGRCFTMATSLVVKTNEPELSNIWTRGILSDRRSPRRCPDHHHH